MPNASIKLGSYVVATKNINSIQEGSVGLVKKVFQGKILPYSSLEQTRV